MRRRVFLGAVARAILAGMATIFLPRLARAKVISPTRLLKGAPNGQVLESLDGGTSWRVCADFGSTIVIQSLAQINGQYVLQADFQGFNLALKSPDGRIWYTSEWTPPSSLIRRTFLALMGE
jgi:hypothetical protein